MELAPLRPRVSGGPRRRGRARRRRGRAGGRPAARAGARARRSTCGCSTSLSEVALGAQRPGSRPHRGPPRRPRARARLRRGGAGRAGRRPPGDDALTARITLRLPEGLKAQIEVAAARERPLRQLVDRARARARARDPFRPRRPAPVRLRRQLKGAQMSRLHPIPYGTGIILVPDWMQPRPRRARREARTAGRGPPCIAAARRSRPSGPPEVRNPAGDVRIETADTAETTVELDALNDDATRRRSSRRRSRPAAARCGRDRGRAAGRSRSAPGDHARRR